MLKDSINHLLIKEGEKAPKMGNNFHALRYMLAAFVLYSHSYGLLKLPEPGLFQFTFGSLAVKCFFALSGYLIALSCIRSASLTSFAINRILRILPALIIATLLSRWIGGYFDNFSANLTPHILNGPVWTLPWEIVCYALCGLLWWFGVLNKTTIGAVIATSWLIYIVMPHAGDTNAVVVPLFLLFFTGAYIALDEERFKIKFAGPFFLLLLLILTLDTKEIGITSIFKYIPFLYGPNFLTQQYNLFVFLFGLPFVLIWLALYVKPILNLRNDYSYGMYILGWPVQQTVIALFSPPFITLCKFFDNHSWLGDDLLAFSREESSLV